MKNKLSLFQFFGRFNDKNAILLLIMLISADMVFILIHAVIDLSPSLRIRDLRLYSISEERSYPEIFQYLKWFWITIVLARMSFSRRSLKYLAWGLLSVYFLLDDSIGIHESVGAKIAASLNFTPPFSMRPLDLGELFVSAISASILLPVIGWSYFRGDHDFKRFSQDMVLLLAIMFLFGVFTDIMAHLLLISEKMVIMIGFAEDAAEMLIASLLLWYVFQSSNQKKGNSIFLLDYFRSRVKTKS
jgi:hypothetical protein